MSEFPAYEAALLQAARRRYGWRRWRLRGAAALVTAAAAAVALLLARPAQPDVEVPASTPVNVAKYGVATRLPAGWQLAGASLTPHLVDPAEILTAATFTPVRRATLGCASLPAVAMGASDALVTVQEWRQVTPAAPRPKRFVYHQSAPAFVRMVQGCITGAAVPSVDTFSVGARSFISIVVLAPDTTRAVRLQALQILDRLRFTATAPAVPAARRGSG